MILIILDFYIDKEGTILHIDKVTDSEILNWLTIDYHSTVTELDNGMLKIRGVYYYCNSYCGVKTNRYCELVEYNNAYYIVEVQGEDIDISSYEYSYTNEILQCVELKKVLDKFNSINNVEPLRY